MGRRSATETVTSIILAFLHQRTWRQAALARKLGVGAPTLRRCLDDLVENGMPLERDEDPPDVYWSVPRDWFPGGVVFPIDEIPELLRQLSHLPRSTARERLVRRVLATAPRQHGAVRRIDAIVTPAVSPSEELLLPIVEDAAAQRVTLYLHYFSASRGALEWRHVSPQRVRVGDRTRVAAVCHRDDALKWFRLENMLNAQLDLPTAFRSVDERRIQAFFDESFDGFHQGTDAVHCAFFVREPESRWIAKNLPGPMEIEPVPGGVRVIARTGGVLPLARYVVGLGAAARAETSELTQLVAQLARGALEGAYSASKQHDDAKAGPMPDA